MRGVGAFDPIASQAVEVDEIGFVGWGFVGVVFDEDVGGFAVAVAKTLEAELGEQLGDLVGEISARGDIVGDVAVFDHGSEILGVGDFFGDKNILLAEAFLKVIEGGEGPGGGQAAVDEHL